MDTQKHPIKKATLQYLNRTGTLDMSIIKLMAPQLNHTYPLDQEHPRGTYPQLPIPMHS